jgi:hypothetical protein
VKLDATHKRLLEALLTEQNASGGELLSEVQEEDFRGFLGRGRELSLREANWVQTTYDESRLDERLVSKGEIPRGRDVQVPEVLRVLPKKPPGRMR